MAMTALLTKADHDIQLAVRDELDWIPELFDAPRIAVGVSKGVVTLTGLVETHLQRVAAKRAAFRVHGVHAVVDRVEIMRAQLGAHGVGDHGRRRRSRASAGPTAARRRRTSGRWRCTARCRGR